MDIRLYISRFSKNKATTNNTFSTMAKKKAAAYRLAKLSLTLRGISHNLGETNDSRFAHALHKGLYFDYMMANPPV